jgi:hypothetical protein
MPDSPLTISKDAVFHLLQNSRRRAILQYLTEYDDDVTSLREVTEQVAAWENDTSVTELPVGCAPAGLHRAVPVPSSQTRRDQRHRVQPGSRDARSHSASGCSRTISRRTPSNYERSYSRMNLILSTGHNTLLPTNDNTTSSTTD